MSVTPNDIRNAKFNTTMRGFNRDEVEAYLERVADALEVTNRELHEVRETHNALKRKHEALTEMEDTLKSTLLDARRAAQITIEQAEKEADQVRLQIEKERQEILHGAQKRTRQVSDEVKRLVTIRDEYISELKKLITSHLSLVNEISKSKPGEYKFDLIDADGEITETEVSEVTEFEPQSIAGDSLMDIETDSFASEEIVSERSIDQSDELPSSSKRNHSVLQQAKTTESGVRSKKTADAITGAKKNITTLEQIASSAKGVVKAKPEPVAQEFHPVEDVEFCSESVEEISHKPAHADLDDTERDIYRKLAAHRDGEAPEKVESKQAPEQPARRNKVDELRGPDGIIVFGRKEDRERALEENARVLRELDSVVDKFAEELKAYDHK